jgi:hypothetical protein
MKYKYVALTNTTIGSFMSQLDSNIVLISLPTIIRELPGTTTFDALWVIMGYILVTATLLLTFGRLADIYGRVRLYNMGFAVFTVGSLLCALSRNGEQLVLFRFLQGGGAALLFANGLGKPLSKAPSGQASDGLRIPFSPVQELPPLMEMNLPDLKMVLANEAFPKGSPRPAFFGFRNRPRHRQAGCKSFRAGTF